MNNRFDRITIDPAVMNGQPCIRGMRLTVKRVVQAVALYPDRRELKQEYPELKPSTRRTSGSALPPIAKFSSTPGPITGLS